MAAYLGEFEQLILLALARLGDDAYGVTIRAALVERWAAGPLPPARLYVRLLRSLVVYAGHERPTEAA